MDGGGRKPRIYRFWHQSIFGDAQHQFELELMGQIALFVSMPGKWAIVPKSIANHFCTYNKLRQCTPDFSIPNRSIYILRHRDKAESVCIHYFIDTLREVLYDQYGDCFIV